MPLYFVKFGSDLLPLLLEAKDETHAAEIALEAAKESPALVTLYPANTFCVEVFAEDDDGNEVILDPLDHVVDQLEAIDAIDAEPAEALCGLEADGPNEEIVTCGLAAGHAGKGHEGLTSSGELVSFSA